MNHSDATKTNALENYFRDMLSPPATKDAAADLPALSTYAMLIEGETVNVALMLDDFAGITQSRHHRTLALFDVDQLNTFAPQPIEATSALIVKIRGLPIALKCKRVETIIDLNNAKLAFHFDDKRPWSAGMVKDYWAMLLDVSKLLDLVKSA